MPTDGLRSLDLFRALSAQVVVIGHAFAFILKQGVPIAGGVFGLVGWRLLGLLSGHGIDAVAVFFVLSGLLVGGPLPRLVRQGRFQPFDYLLRRASRMYVVLVPGLAISALLVMSAFAWGDGASVIAANTPWYPEGWPVAESMSLSTGACNLAFLQTVLCPQFMHNSALWSLSNEVMYYAAFPALLTLPRTLTRRGGWVSGAILCAVGAAWGYAEFREPGRGLMFAVGFVAWLMGAYSETLIPMFWPHGPFGSVAFSLGVSAAGLAAVRSGDSSLRFLGIAAGVLVALRHQGLVEAALRRMALVARAIKLGSDYSYSLYVVHLPLLFALLSVSPMLREKVTRSAGTFAAMVTILAAINVVAYLFHRVFECHYRGVYLWLRERFAPRQTA